MSQKNTLYQRLEARLRPAAKKLFSTGFFHIFLTNILTKAIGLVGGILLARMLSKTAYANYAYVLNAMGILELLADMGTGMTSLQFCSENHENEAVQRAWFSYAFRFSMLAETMSCLLMLTARWFYPLRFPEAGGMLAWMALLPLVSNVNRFLLLNAQIQLKNQIYARINLFTSLITYLVMLPMAHFYSWQGALLSAYVIQTVTAGFALWQTRSFLQLSAPCGLLARGEKVRFWRLAFSSALNNAINNSLTLIDIFLLGLFITNLDVIASYKVSSTFPTALVFIPTAIDTYAMPLFARHRQNILWVKENYLRAIGALSALNLLICGGMIVLSKPFITFLYGAKYEDAAQCLAILMIGYFFSAIRAVSFTVIYTQRKVKINVFVTLLCNGLNVLLDIPFIRLWGSVGAAWASTGMNILAAVLMVIYLLTLLNKNQRIASELPKSE